MGTLEPDESIDQGGIDEEMQQDLSFTHVVRSLPVRQNHLVEQVNIILVQVVLLLHLRSGHLVA